MDYAKMTIQQLKIEIGIRDKRLSMWKAAKKELEQRYQQAPDISNEPAIVEILEAVSKGK